MLAQCLPLEWDRGITAGIGEVLIQGFAAEVNVNNEEYLPEAVLLKINPPKDSEVEPVNLRRFGTRHRSAARLCSKLGARVFVVSKDGAIRAFERLNDGKISISGPFACGPGLSPDPLSGTFIDVRAPKLQWGLKVE